MDSAPQSRPSLGDRVPLGQGLFTYRCLQMAYQKALRSGGWRRLALEDRALFRCALWLAKARGRIRNLKLMARIAGIVMRMLSNFRAHAMRAGLARAERLKACLKARGASGWAQRALGWLRDKDFVFYLGVLELNG